MKGLNLIHLFFIVTIGGLIVPFAMGYWQLSPDAAPEDVRHAASAPAPNFNEHKGWSESGIVTEAPLNVRAPPRDATFSKSGLAYKIIRPGSGAANPGRRDRVTVHYSGWTTDGKLFDSSISRKRSATFPLNGVIKGWTEGLRTMRVGEIRRLWIPEKLAYQGKPGRPAGMLVFDVELLKIDRVVNLPAPADVEAPPSNAIVTESGLAYRFLEKAPSPRRHPGPTDKVTVHYSGWTTDGDLFDSSRTRGKEATFPLNGVIKGWTEGLQLMSPKDKARFWIPAELAYGEKPRPGAPAGMLVFDVELIDFEPRQP